MTFQLKYPDPAKCGMQRSFSGLLVLLTLLLLVSTSPAQNNSAQSNSASSASSAHSSAAPPTGSIAPSTGAIAPHTGGIAPPTGGANTHNGPSNSGVIQPNFPHSPGASHHGDHHPHHTANGNGIAYYPYVYPYVYAVPYTADTADADTPTDDADDDPEYQGGPTIFDRRGSGADSYVPPVDNAPPAHAQTQDAQATGEAQADTSPAPAPQLDPTVLVFKDGHQVEIRNYAVVSLTLYDLTPGHPRKIALADLDLVATEKLNDDRGVSFELPSSSQAN